MIFGDPYQFAVWVQDIPEWGDDSHRNGLFHFMIDGKIFPECISTASLGAEFNQLNNSNALITLPENCEIFHKPKEDAFHFMLGLAYPDYRSDFVDGSDDFENVFLYKISNLNAQDCGCYIFCVACSGSVRVLGAKVKELVANGDETSGWVAIPQIKVAETIVPAADIKHIVEQLYDFELSIRPSNSV